MSFMIFDSKPISLDRLARFILNGLVIMSCIWLLNFLADVLLPFVIAASLAYFINPLVVWVQKRVKHRGLAIACSFLMVTVILAVALAYVVPKFYTEMHSMAQLLHKMTVESNLDEAAKKRLPPEVWDAIREPLRSEWLRSQFSNPEVLQAIKGSAQKILPGLLRVIQGTASLLFSLVGLVVIGLYLVFILMEYPNYRRSWKLLLPPAARTTISVFVKDFDRALSQYFRAQALIASIVAILFAIGFKCIGLPMALILGILLGLLNMVPYLQIVGLLPCFFLVVVQGLETNQSFLQLGAYVLVVFGVVQVIQDAILVPKIMGKASGLSPAMMLLSLSIWGKLLGLFGLVIAIPITCLCLAYYRQLLQKLEVQSES